MTEIYRRYIGEDMQSTKYELEGGGKLHRDAQSFRDSQRTDFQITENLSVLDAFLVALVCLIRELGIVFLIFLIAGD